MPELPEVETVRRGLEDHLVGATIAKVEGAGGRLVRNNPQGVLDIIALARGQQVASVERRGKFMWITFAASDDALVVHLGMSGQARVFTPAPADLAKHEHLRFTVGGEGEPAAALSFIDPRMFGQLTVSPLVHDPFGRLIPEAALRIAPDPFEDVPTAFFVTRLARTSRPIKTALLDQAIISGIGNIYADEALYSAGVHGARVASTLLPRQLVELVEAAREVMGRALAVGGTSFDSLYVNAEGDPGYFSRSLSVYGRAGGPCGNCGCTVERTVIQGRSHFFCRSCQSVPRTRVSR